MIGLPDELKVKVEIHPRKRPYVEEIGKIMEWFKRIGVGREDKV